MDWFDILFCALAGLILFVVFGGAWIERKHDQWVKRVQISAMRPN